MDETKGKKKFSKKRIIVIAIAVVFLILLFPVPFTIKDGGSKGFEAILYNVTHWNSMSITKAEDGREYDSLIKGTTVEILGFTVYDSRWVDVGDVLGPTSTPSPTDAPATPTETVTPTGAATPTVAPGPTVSWDECMKKYAIPKIDAAIDGTSYAYSEVFSSAAEGDRLSYSVYDSDSEFYHAPNNLPVNENYLCDNCISEIRRYDRNMNVRKITYYADKSFDFIVKTSPVPVQLIDAAKVKGGSGEPNRKKVASVTWDQVKAIAEDKMPDLNCFTLASAMRMVAGTARSMGITVKGEFPENV